jgi:histidyl-tRNA synthetase
MLTQAPKGTKDILPSESYKWQFIEKKINEICADFGYKEIRTPVFEHTELFQRGVGILPILSKKKCTLFWIREREALH